ncbi:hypothetical protein GOP47_0026236 [Adiantum capillus-veneris]|nr:hypothetical protein GOP47_0026236 [Adiantum capillus-veneris]
MTGNVCACRGYVDRVSEGGAGARGEMSQCGQWSASTFLSSLCRGRLRAPTYSLHLPSPTLQVVCCSQHESNRNHGVFKDEVESPPIARREVLSAVALMASVWAPLSSDVQLVHAADLTQRIQRSKLLGSIQEKLRVFVKENQSLIPSLLQLALNDASTYNKASKSGGPNGSIYFSAELNRPENKDLAGVVQMLEILKKDIDSASPGGPITWADLVQIAGQSAIKRVFLNAAIKKCGGNVQKGETLYSAYGSSGQWGQFDKQLGRSQATEPDPEGRVLFWDQAPIADIKAKFDQLGFKPRQLAVMAVFLGPDLSVTEAKLASDPEIAPWVDKYQKSRATVSQTDYEVDLITTFTKLSTLGQTINYEAYSYAPPRIKLKL